MLSFDGAHAKRPPPAAIELRCARVLFISSHTRRWGAARYARARARVRPRNETATAPCEGWTTTHERANKRGGESA